MTKNLLELSNDGLKDFSEHPVKYSFSAVVDFVRDYWDVGAAVLAGAAFWDLGGAFGDAGKPLALGGLIATGLGSMKGDNRARRNFYAGLSSFCGSWTVEAQSGENLKIGSYVVSLIPAIAAYLEDKDR